jgi:hypothetical protein
MINVSQYYQYRSCPKKKKNSENQLHTTKGRFVLFVSVVSFSATNITFEVN